MASKESALTMAAEHAPARPKQNVIIFVFGAFGPLAPILAFIISLMPTRGLAVFTSAVPDLVFFFAYLVGTVPALITGWFYAFAPRAWQRIVLSPIYGALASAPFALLIGFRELDMVLIAGAVGAVAAPMCAIVVRLLKADLRGAERDA